MSPRSDRGARVAAAIKAKGGNVKSVLPPRPGENVVFETRAPETANAILAWLSERGIRVTDLGSVSRLIHNATTETVEFELGDGRKGTRTVEHPGHALLHAFEVVLPSDAAMREIPGRSPPRPVKPPPQRRRRG
jgi:hypothetical protein